MECKQEIGKKLSNEEVFNEMVSQFKEAEKREPSEAELKEIKNFVESR